MLHEIVPKKFVNNLGYKNEENSKDEVLNEIHNFAYRSNHSTTYPVVFVKCPLIMAIVSWTTHN